MLIQCFYKFGMIYPQIWDRFPHDKMLIQCNSQGLVNGYGSIPINTIFSGMNIHLPAILMFTRGTGF